MDSLTAEQRRKNMQAIKSKGTKPEISLAKALWEKGLRYRKQDKSLPGKPDFIFKSLKIAVFCDGEFWHGKDWQVKKPKIQTRREYWIPKIEKNIRRDEEVNSALEKQGWTVIRFWEKDIKRNLDQCLKVIEKTILMKKHLKYEKI
jgi:DNA mismatch endonuclease Vsr